MQSYIKYAEIGEKLLQTEQLVALEALDLLK